MKDQDSRKLARKWQDRITQEKKKHKKFHERAEKAIEVYENDRKADAEGDNKVYFPVLRSVVDVQLGALTSKMPQARIAERFEKQKAEGQPVQDTSLCEKLELAVNYFIEKGNMQNEVFQSAEDYLTAGVGGMRVVYDAEYVEKPIIESIDDGFGNITEYVTGEYEEVIQSETLLAERFEWCNFGWQPCARWKDCDWIRFESTFSLKDFKDKYDVEPVKLTDANKETDTVTVHEIWDRAEQRRIVICDCHDDVLENDENPLNTEYFYPCSEPMFFALADDELTPCPEFYFWESLHDRIQYLSKRETRAIKRYKDLTFYDQNAFNDAVRIESANDGDKIPVDLKPYVNSTGQPDINKLFMAKDNTSTAVVLDMIERKIDQGLSRIYQITGIGDIMQAASDPNETATAQNLKHSWGSARLSSKRFNIENHIRGTIEVMVNTMVKLFDPQSIALAAGKPLTEIDVYELKNTDEYRIDVETLSTLSIDKDRDQQNTSDMVNSLSGLFNPQLAIPQPLQLVLAKSLTETFVNGREIQDTVDHLEEHMGTVAQLQQQIDQMGAELQKAQEQSMAMAQELNKYNEAKMRKDYAEAQKKEAEVVETQAKTEKLQIESAQKANEVFVQPDAMLDEQIALQQQPTQFYPQ